jgi:hypothetical protein
MTRGYLDSQIRYDKAGCRGVTGTGAHVKPALACYGMPIVLKNHTEACIRKAVVWHTDSQFLGSHSRHE